jgi:serine/threonine protein phosphatase PrpC
VIPVYVEASGQTDVGLVRTNNEDALVIANLTTDQWDAAPCSVRHEVGERGVLLAVSDGMGGAEAGEVASAIVVESLREHLLKPGDATPTAVSSAVKKTNRDVWVAARVSGRKEMGATLAAIIIGADEAHIASVGDSRAYILRENRIRQITKDQSYIAALIDAGYAEEDLKNSPFKNVILQAMGTKPDVVVALGKIALRQSDVFLLCSDGLWDKVSNEEIFKTITSTADLAAACVSLIDLAKERGGDDNITVVAARVMGAEIPKPIAHETVTETYESLEEFDLKKIYEP